MAGLASEMTTPGKPFPAGSSAIPISAPVDAVCAQARSGKPEYSTTAATVAGQPNSRREMARIDRTVIGTLHDGEGVRYMGHYCREAHPEQQFKTGWISYSWLEGLPIPISLSFLTGGCCENRRQYAIL